MIFFQCPLRFWLIYTLPLRLSLCLKYFASLPLHPLPLIHNFTQLTPTHPSGLSSNVPFSREVFLFLRPCLMLIFTLTVKSHTSLSTISVFNFVFKYFSCDHLIMSLFPHQTVSSIRTQITSDFAHQFVSTVSDPASYRRSCQCIIFLLINEDAIIGTAFNCLTLPGV